MTDNRNSKCVCTTCGGRYTVQNRATHRKTKKHLTAVLDNNIFEKHLMEFEQTITKFVDMQSKFLQMVKDGHIVLYKGIPIFPSIA
jgi:S-adenosylhomocysteine hydrolase